MKSLSQAKDVASTPRAPSGPMGLVQDMGNAAAQDGLDAVGLSDTPTLDALGLPENPASSAAAALGLDGLNIEDDHVSFEGKGLSLDESIDMSLGALGPLTVGLHGSLATNLSYGFAGDIVGGWFGGRYAEITGHAEMDLDTSVMAKVALNLLVAEGGLRGGLSLKGGLRGEVSGCVSLAEDGVHLDSLVVSVSGEAELGAAAELYLNTVVSDEQTWELGALPLGVAGGFSLQLTWGDAGLTGIDGSLGSGFVMSPELEALIADLEGRVGM